MTVPLRRRALLSSTSIWAALLIWAGPSLAQKTDIVVLNNGDRITGEIKGLTLGQLEYSTDAASTIYIEWPKIRSVDSNKTFEIELADGQKLVGSVRPAATPDTLRLMAAEDTLEVALISVVALERIKKTFWKRLDGDINVGADYTQDQNQVSLNLSANVHYIVARKRYAFNISTSFSRQDSASNISSLTATLAYQRQFGGRWFYTGFLAGEQSSQLSLDIRGSGAGGLGRYFVRTNKVDFSAWGGFGYSQEKYVDQPSDGSPIAVAATNLEYFTFGDLTTNLSTGLTVTPVLNDGRVRLNFLTQYKREVANNLYLTLSLSETFDSKPPEEANKNDLSLTTSIGWSF